MPRNGSKPHETITNVRRFCCLFIHDTFTILLTLFGMITVRLTLQKLHWLPKNAVCKTVNHLVKLQRTTNELQIKQSLSYCNLSNRFHDWSLKYSRLLASHGILIIVIITRNQGLMGNLMHHVATTTNQPTDRPTDRPTNQPTFWTTSFTFHYLSTCCLYCLDCHNFFHDFSTHQSRQLVRQFRGRATPSFVAVGLPSTPPSGTRGHVAIGKIPWPFFFGVHDMDHDESAYIIINWDTLSVSPSHKQCDYSEDLEGTFQKITSIFQ